MDARGILRFYQTLRYKIPKKEKEKSEKFDKKVKIFEEKVKIWKGKRNFGTSR